MRTSLMACCRPSVTFVTSQRPMLPRVRWSELSRCSTTNRAASCGLRSTRVVDTATPWNGGGTGPTTTRRPASGCVPRDPLPCTSRAAYIPSDRSWRRGRQRLIGLCSENPPVWRTGKNSLQRPAAMPTLRPSVVHEGVLNVHTEAADTAHFLRLLYRGAPIILLCTAAVTLAA